MLKTRRNKRTNRRGVYCPRCLPEGVRSISLPILVLALVLFIIIDVIALFIVISIIVSFPTSFPTGNGNMIGTTLLEPVPPPSPYWGCSEGRILPLLPHSLQRRRLHWVHIATTYLGRPL